jgi:hypothetical protein
VAKATILICDCCRTQQPAVGTLDLCANHLKAARALRNDKPTESKKHGGWNKADYVTINQKIMELADARPMFTGADVLKATKVSAHIGKYAITGLIEAGKLVATGTGAGRKLSKAS